jgi:hypothetical protein
VRHALSVYSASALIFSVLPVKTAINADLEGERVTQCSLVTACPNTSGGALHSSFECGRQQHVELAFQGVAAYVAGSAGKLGENYLS